jgi:Ca-activated chloride channel family protein
LSVNANVRNNVTVAIAVLLVTAACRGASARQAVRAGNELYAKKDWQGAAAAYDKAMTDEPLLLVPKFNKGDALYQAGDIPSATDVYKKVAAEAKEMPMVARAKYNLGNCRFKEGIRQKDSDLDKSMESLQEAVKNWKDAMEIEPKYEKARRNIEVARLVIKDIMDEQKKRQEQQKNDPNSTQQQDNKDQQQNKDGQQQKQDQKQQGQQEPNQPGKQDQDQKDKQEQKAAEKQKQEEKENQQKEGQAQKAQEKKDAPDATAQQILDDEQERKKQLRPNQPGGYAPVDQDW